MNFNVYIPKDIGAKLSKATEALHCSRNSIVTEAVSEWLQVHMPSEWPENFFSFQAIDDVPDFKAMRSDLVDVENEDPFV